MNYLKLEKNLTHPEIFEYVQFAFRELVPLSFFIIPASRSNHHPEISRGVGGLVRHTLLAVEMAQNLFPLAEFDDLTQQHILAALYLHDIAKPSKLHPIEAKEILIPSSPHYYPIIKLIESHMGQWDAGGILPRPQTDAQKYVHLCDYIVSRV